MPSPPMPSTLESIRESFQRLEGQIADKDRMITAFAEQIEQLKAERDKANRERDLALRDLKIARAAYSTRSAPSVSAIHKTLFSESFLSHLANSGLIVQTLEVKNRPTNITRDVAASYDIYISVVEILPQPPAPSEELSCPCATTF